VADRRPIALHERNDEQLLLTINRQDPGDDLTVITIVEVYLKTESCQSDSDPATLALTSADPAQVLVTSVSAAQILATVYIPAAALVGPYDRFWRVDGLTAGGARRTAMYGPVTVVDL
jgi:hypothetical protein